MPSVLGSVFSGDSSEKEGLIRADDEGGAVGGGSEGGGAKVALGSSSSGGGLEGGFSYWVGVAFCVNYIMGCGFLSIPHRFVGSGVLLGPLVVGVFCILMNVSKDFVLEAMGR